MQKLLFGSKLKGTWSEGSDIDIVYVANTVQEALQDFEREHKPKLYMISQLGCVTYVNAVGSDDIEYELYMLTCNSPHARQILAQVAMDMEIAKKIQERGLASRVIELKDKLKKCGVYGNYYGVPGILIELMLIRDLPPTVLYGGLPEVVRLGFDYNRVIAMSCINETPSGDALMNYLRYVSPYKHSVFRLDNIVDVAVMKAVLKMFEPLAVPIALNYAFATRVGNAVVVGYRDVDIPISVTVPPTNGTVYVEGHYGVVAKKISVDLSKFPAYYRAELSKFRIVFK